MRLNMKRGSGRCDALHFRAIGPGGWPSKIHRRDLQIEDALLYIWLPPANIRQQ